MTLYFKANKKALDAYNDHLKDVKRVRRKWRLMMKEVGAEDFLYNPTRMYCIGFKFKEKPDSKLWKASRSGSYLPKKSTKAGKELDKRLSEIKKDKEIWKHLLDCVGYGKAPFLSEWPGTMHYSPGMCRSKDKKFLLVSYTKDAYKHKDFKLPRGFKELTFSQYEKLSGEG
jgi:hypothetical protein